MELKSVGTFLGELGLKMEARAMEIPFAFAPEFVTVALTSFVLLPD